MVIKSIGRVLFLGFLVCCTSITAFASGNDSYVEIADETLPVNQPMLSNYAQSTVIEPHLASYAESAILMEAGTGKVLFEKNADEKREPASITKIMTMALVLEQIEQGKLKYDDMVTASQNAKDMGGTQINLDVGEQMKVYDLLMSVAVASANDASVALAEHIGNGSEAAFVDLMNKKAKELGMTNTTFANPNGLPNPSHQTTARDIALMSRHLLSIPSSAEFIGTDRYPVRSGENEYMMRNSNALIREYQGCIGLKTGYTQAAGHCLSAAASRDNMTLVAVVLGESDSKTRFMETAALLDYGFAGFTLYTPKVEFPTIEPITVKGGTVSEFVVASPEGEIPPQVIKRGHEPKVDTQFTGETVLTAPVEAGQEVGRFAVTMDGEVIYQHHYIAPHSVAHRDFFSSVSMLLRNMVTL